MTLATNYATEFIGDNGVAPSQKVASVTDDIIAKPTDPAERDGEQANKTPEGDKATKSSLQMTSITPSMTALRSSKKSEVCNQS